MNAEFRGTSSLCRLGREAERAFEVTIGYLGSFYVWNHRELEPTFDREPGGCDAVVTLGGVRIGARRARV